MVKWEAYVSSVDCMTNTQTMIYLNIGCIIDKHGTEE